MNIRAHRLYITTLVVIVILVLFMLIINGYDYYQTHLNQRFFHSDYQFLKPSGSIGHGLGIIGTFLMILGIVSYMVRKRSRKLSRLGYLKHWLEFHIFLCTLGPILILFHTSFKFGGIVSVSFWSMVAVFLSGVIGRFIYIQIPRTIEGRELSLKEVTESKTGLIELLEKSSNISKSTFNLILDSTKKKIEIYKSNLFIRLFNQFKADTKSKNKIKASLRKDKVIKAERKKIMKLVDREISLNRKIERLDTMKNLFKYWHVAHLPFAFIMMIIMIVHVVVTITFGYKWIF